MARQMKDSGIEWIGEIPETWMISKNKYLLTSMYSGGTPSAGNPEFYDDENGVPFVSISDMSTTAFVGSTKKGLTEAGIADKGLVILPAGTVLYSIYATVGAVSELAIPATINQAMLALMLKPDVCKAYYKYCLLAMKDYIFGSANGNTQFNLNAEKVWNFTFPLPIQSTQQRIAAFLDRKCTEIDVVIERTKATIEEYKKLKQAVITEAVTKGVRGARKMKDSGIEMIGSIPSDWACTRVSRIATVVRGGSPRPAGDSRFFNGNFIPWITVAEVTNTVGHYITSTETCLTEEGAKCSRIVEAGTLLLSNSGATLGVPKITSIRGCINDGSVAFYNLEIDKKYLLYVFASYTDELRKQRQGYGQPNLNTDIIKGLYIPQPPEYEQEEIVDYLDEKCTALDALIAKKTALLTELETYKKSLIYEYVTGKKEVG